MAQGADRAASPEVAVPCLLLVRSLSATALVVGSLSVLGAALLGAAPPGRVPPALLLPVCLLGIAAYCYELRSRHVWAVARSFLTGGSFEACAEAMREAAPLLDLEVPGCEAVPYKLVQWRDETVWLDLLQEAHGGLVLASFPLEFIPGDHSEALALDTAGACVAEQAGTAGSPREADAALAPTAALRLRLRWPDGLETGEPVARLLSYGPKGAEWPCPGLLFLACIFLLGLVVDLLLLRLAQPVEWPIRKRFFTREGGRLGTLSFSCSSDGVVEMDGDPKELRTANRFWIRDEAHWRAVEREVAGLGPALIRLRWLRRLGQCSAVLLAVIGVGRLVLSPGALVVHKAFWLLLLGALAVAAGFWGLGPLADCLAKRQVEAASEKLGGLLPGGATITATWAADDSVRDLSIEVEQPKPSEGKQEELPILRTSTMLTKSTSATLNYSGAPQWSKVPQPVVHRSGTV